MKVKLFKNKNKLHLTTSFKEVDGYECPWTGALFDDKKKYVSYLSLVRKRNSINRLIDKVHTLDNFSAIICFLEKNWECIAPDFFQECFTQKEKIDPQLLYFKVTHFSMQYNESVSNSHSAPKGKPTNWSRAVSLPTGYPGWYGSIAFATNIRLNYSSKINLNNVCVRTGGGGSSNGIDYHYEVKMFADDWPALYKNRSKEQVAAILEGRPIFDRFAYVKV